MTLKNNTMRNLINYYKPYKKLFVVNIVCSFLIASIDLVVPMISRRVLNSLPNIQIRNFSLVILLVLGLYISRGIFQYVVDYWGHILGVRMEYDMRRDIFKHIQTFSFDFYDKKTTGHIMSRVVNDLNEITEFAHHGPEDLFLSLIMLIGSFFMLITIEWRLAIAVYLVIPLLIWFTIKQRSIMARNFKDVKKKIANINSQLESSLSGIRVTKAFTNELHEIKKFSKDNKEFRDSRNTAFKNMAIFLCGINFTTNILNIIVIGLGGYLIYKGMMNLADLIAFMLYINSFIQPIRKLTYFVQQYESGMAGFKRFKDLMDIEPLITDKENAKELKEVKGSVQFRDITFSYDGNNNILENINLHINSGKTLALVGPSGGGKTTLCHLLPRFYDAKKGDIIIDGNNIKDIKLKSLRQNIGIVSQDVFLFPETIKDNIRYGNLKASDQEIVKAAKYAEIHDFIIKLPNGYDTNVGERGIRLSGGQKQRICIARVFLKNPSIIILDEATSSLDNKTEVNIKTALKRLCEGKTTLIIAHRLSTIKDADEIVLITEEGIKEKGKHEQLIQQNGYYKILYESELMKNGNS